MYWASKIAWPLVRHKGVIKERDVLKGTDAVRCSRPEGSSSCHSKSMSNKGVLFKYFLHSGKNIHVLEMK